MSAPETEHESGRPGGGLYARRWDDETPARPAHPAPLAPAVTCEPTELPRTRAAMVRARGAGWRTRATVSTGYRPLGRAPWVAEAPSTVHVLHARHGGTDTRAPVTGAAGMWVDGSFAGAHAWTVCADPDCPRGANPHPADVPRRISSTALRALLRSDEPDPNGGTR